MRDDHELLLECRCCPPVVDGLAGVLVGFVKGDPNEDCDPGLVKTYSMVEVGWVLLLLLLLLLWSEREDALGVGDFGTTVASGS